ncbi:MAG: molybdenum cofactor biosynthesis protein MoaE [Flavobacteriia bacterium]|nr:molybdenum cofactor biosynthesis protein MoaE [Flavobacteriia bacterium]
MDINIKIVSEIDTTIGYHYLAHEESGGHSIFIGSVRNSTQNETVHELFFEAYESMALLEMEKIAKEASQKWNLQKVIMHHAVGTKKVKEPIVLVGASSAHREACFEACRFLIDTLKERVPIWKKEFFENKKVWVTPHP